MSILKLRYFFTGYLIITVKGQNTEKFINLAIRHKIPLWDIRWREGRAVVKVDLDGFYELRHLAFRTGCRLHIERKAGFPFLYNRFMHRRGIVLGVSFFIISLYVLSSFILFIGVEGNETLDSNYIRELAARSGAYRGMPKEKLDKDKVANRMLMEETHLEWVGLHLQGTRLIIEVVEDIKPPVDVDTPANLVAAKDGLITDVLVIAGEAKVKPGDTVIRGQLLVEGVLRPQVQYAPEDDSEPAPVPVRARGEVTARVWYEGYGEAQLSETICNRTGKKSSVWTLFVEGQPVLRVGRSTVPFVHYETVTSSRSFTERIIRFPVEIITETHYEVTLNTNSIPREEALEIALERAKTLAELQLPEGETIENETSKLVLDQDGLIGIRYVLETKENIAAAEQLNAYHLKGDRLE